MMKIGHFVAFAAFAAFSASCIGSGEESEQEALDAFRGTMQECHVMEARLRGRGASLWKVVNAPDLVAVQVDNDIVCVDTVEQTLDIGIIAVPPFGEPINGGGFTDGSPIPADKWNSVARERLRGRGMPIDF